MQNTNGEDISIENESKPQHSRVRYQGKENGRSYYNYRACLKELHFGSPITNIILSNFPYQNWFVKRFNVVVFENELKWYATENYSDVNSTVDAYIPRQRELQHNGIFMDGIGLESHFTVPNLPLVRTILDKFATLDLPIWLTEVDISKTLDKNAQAILLRGIGGQRIEEGLQISR
ncbi:PREDICTED: uncharacterized protein LOC109340677 [Lupinus angustifolius]|uniref:uncharacterized protein LOC109340677 n=1 Tax=Lupinus angustifolius TaxID=3871 RepID=UPI00092FAEE5|nr:PREDICTED: uncharacterized protein LOC109340677 [Lupinus angustifolius]